MSTRQANKLSIFTTANPVFTHQVTILSRIETKTAINVFLKLFIHTVGLCVLNQELIQSFWAQFLSQSNQILVIKILLNIKLRLMTNVLFGTFFHKRKNFKNEY